MSLYYMLNEDDYEGNREEIGSIMLKFVQQLYKETGLNLNQYAGPTTEEINKHFNNGNVELLLEKVIWKNLEQSEKIETLSNYLEDIEAENGDLTIIDPYLFPKKSNDSYEDFIIGVLNSINLKSIQFITSKGNHNQDLFNNIKDKCNCKNINLDFTDDYHDRLWIANRRKAFIMGTSLNGLGKKISLIDFINEEDLQDIIKDLDKR